MCAPRLVKRHAVPSTVGFFFFGSHIVLIYYIPIYFQSIEVVAAIEPGVRNLLFIIAVSIFTVVSGVLISMTSYPAPFLTVDAALATIRCGLIYTLDIGNSTGKWTGYEILAGVGSGLGVQFPIIMTQAYSDADDMAATTAILMCKLAHSSSNFKMGPTY